MVRGWNLGSQLSTKKKLKANRSRIKYSMQKTKVDSRSELQKIRHAKRCLATRMPFPHSSWQTHWVFPNDSSTKHQEREQMIGHEYPVDNHALYSEMCDPIKSALYLHLIKSKQRRSEPQTCNIIWFRLCCIDYQGHLGYAGNKVEMEYP